MIESDSFYPVNLIDEGIHTLHFLFFPEMQPSGTLGRPGAIHPLLIMPNLGFMHRLGVPDIMELQRVECAAIQGAFAAKHGADNFEIGAYDI